MNKILYTKISKKSFIEDAMRHFVIKYITKKNEKYAARRKNRMAVFANDYIGMRIYIDEYYEKEEIYELINIMNLMKIETKSFNAIDVGANIGNHTSIFAKHFSHVHSFEPNPHTYKILAFNAGFEDNVTVYNLGLSNENGNLTLSEVVSNYGASSVVYVKEGSNNIQIEVRKLDDFYDAINGVGLIKIDVEGMEYQVLSGALKIINRDCPVIIFEQHDNEFYESGETKSISLLRSLGYEILFYKNKNANHGVIIRRLFNIYEMFFGRKIVTSIVLSKKVAPNYYPMLIAIHPQNIKNSIFSDFNK